VTKVYEVINGKALPMIGVTDKGPAALENGDTPALPSLIGAAATHGASNG
jgi:hypothetical protein